jgi:hypothetical protein
VTGGGPPRQPHAFSAVIAIPTERSSQTHLQHSTSQYHQSQAGRIATAERTQQRLSARTIRTATASARAVCSRRAITFIRALCMLKSMFYFL